MEVEGEGREGEGRGVGGELGEDAFVHSGLFSQAEARSGGGLLVSLGKVVLLLLWLLLLTS